MKIGVMTYWWSNDNYGQQLQCYALQKYLRDAGHDAYLIRYDMSGDYAKPPPKPLWKKICKAVNPFKLYRYLSYKKKETALAIENAANRKRGFEDFRNRHIRQSERIYQYYSELKENPPKADMYIAGSDQVWNPAIFPSVERQTRAYFLDFGDPSTKRVSYAASFCGEVLDDEFTGIAAPLLKKFDYVSVREISGLSVCGQCGIDNAELAPDPVMLLDAGAYRELYRGELMRMPDRPYCLIYLINNPCGLSADSVFGWAKENGLATVYVSANSQLDRFKKTYATVPEWLYLLENAECVVTNSYHCAVFSLMFEKRFGVASLTGNCAGMNSRFDTLFETFGIEERFIDSSGFGVLDRNVDWKAVSDTFLDIRGNCKLLDLDGMR
jgi:hypothetical protein